MVLARLSPKVAKYFLLFGVTRWDPNNFKRSEIALNVRYVSKLVNITVSCARWTIDRSHFGSRLVQIVVLVLDLWSQMN